MASSSRFIDQLPGSNCQIAAALVRRVIFLAVLSFFVPPLAFVSYYKSSFVNSDGSPDVPGLCFVYVQTTNALRLSFLSPYDETSLPELFYRWSTIDSSTLTGIFERHALSSVNPAWILAALRMLVDFLGAQAALLFLGGFASQFCPLVTWSLYLFIVWLGPYLAFDTVISKLETLCWDYRIFIIEDRFRSDYYTFLFLTNAFFDLVCVSCKLAHHSWRAFRKFQKTQQEPMFSVDFQDLEYLVRRQVVLLLPRDALNDLWKSDIPEIQSLVKRYRGIPVRDVKVTLSGRSTNKIFHEFTNEPSLNPMNPESVHIRSSLKAPSKNTSSSTSTKVKEYPGGGYLVRHHWDPDDIHAQGVTFTRRQFWQMFVPGVKLIDITECDVTPVVTFADIAHILAEATYICLGINNMKIGTGDIFWLADMKRRVPIAYRMVLYNVDADVAFEAIHALYRNGFLRWSYLQIHFAGQVPEETVRRLEIMKNRYSHRRTNFTCPPYIV